MRSKLQFGVAILAAASLLGLVGTTLAQKPNTNRPPQSPPAAAPSHPQSSHANANRPPANANRASANANRRSYQPPAPAPRFSNPNRSQNYASGAVMNRRQQPGTGSPKPWVDTMRDLTPYQRERVLQNSHAFQSLSPEKQNKIRQQFNQWDRMTPSQRADLREKESTWRRLTPEQQQHIRSDVWPKWNQMPWDRQQVMKQRLGVLQNMPESARNQRLNDPSFTRGMSEEEKSVLRELAHTHVGAPPDPPSE